MRAYEVLSMTKKLIDCIEMKRQVVSEAQQKVAGMNVAEKIAYYKLIGDRERAAQETARCRHNQDWHKLEQTIDDAGCIGTSGISDLSFSKNKIIIIAQCGDFFARFNTILPR